MNEVLDVFAALESDDVPYCLLRNFDEIYGDRIESDIDVLVPASERAVVERRFDDMNWRQRSGDTSHQTRFTKMIPDEGTEVVFDLYWGTATYNGLRLIDGTQVLENRRQFRDVWIPSPEDYFVELVFHSVLNKNDVRPTYREELRRLGKDVDERRVYEHANDLFGDPGRSAVSRALHGEFENLPELKPRLLLAGLRRSPSSVFTLLFNLLVLREVLRPIASVLGWANPLDRTPVIAVIGPDGIGKSTAVNGLAERLEAAGFEVTTARLGVHSGGSAFIRTIRRVYNWVVGWDPQAEARGAGEATLDSRSSELAAVLLVFDFLLRYVRVQFTDADVVVADRYVHELVAYANADRIRRLFPLFEPDRFCGIVLDGPVEAVATRSEFTVDSVDEFYRRLESVRWPRVDTGDGPEATVDELAAFATTVLGGENG